MSTIKTNKDIPIPKREKCVYPWKTLLIGDSFFLKDKKWVCANIYKLAEYQGMKVTVKKENDGYRVWRIK